MYRIDPIFAREKTNRNIERVSYSLVFLESSIPDDSGAKYPALGDAVRFADSIM